MPEKTVRLMLAYLKRVSAKKAVLGLDALQSPALRVGFRPEPATPKWAELLATTDDSIHEAMSKLLQDIGLWPERSLYLCL